MSIEPTLLSSSSMSSYKNSATALWCMQLAHSKGLDRVIKFYFLFFCLSRCPFVVIVLVLILVVALYDRIETNKKKPKGGI